MGNWCLILIRNLGIEYANDRLSLNGRSARLRQDELGCLCVNVNPRITYNMTQSPWAHPAAILTHRLDESRAKAARTRARRAHRRARRT